MMIPKELFSKIGTPQKISRTLVIDGLDVLVRLQKPWEEPPEEIGFNIAFSVDNEGNITPLTKSINEEEWMEYGTCLIIEAWSDVTDSVVTQGIRAGEGQTDAEFAFGCRYMLNNGTDEEWLEVLSKRKIDYVLKLACDNKVKFIERTVKSKKKKKK